MEEILADHDSGPFRCAGDRNFLMLNQEFILPPKSKPMAPDMSKGYSRPPIDVKNWKTAAKEAGGPVNEFSQLTILGQWYKNSFLLTFRTSRWNFG
jgi:hypothetical protein